MKFQLVINFNDLDDLKNFIEDQEMMEIKKLKKLFKKEEGTDKRGHQTKNLHQRAKEYQLNNPEITYKQSLQLVGKAIREDKANITKQHQDEELSSKEEQEVEVEVEEEFTKEIVIGTTESINRYQKSKKSKKQNIKETNI